MSRNLRQINFEARDFSNEVDERMLASSEYSADDKFNKKILGPWRRLTPDYDSFDYDREEIEEDKKRVELYKKRNAEAKKREGYIGKTEEVKTAEAIAMEGIYNSFWLGENVSVIPTTGHDDFHSGCDFVVTFDTPEGLVHLGIDMAVTKDKFAIDVKLEKVIQNLSNGRLSRIKYYDNEDFGEENGSVDLPRVVMGIERDNISQLQNLMVKKDSSLLNHEVKYEMLEEIKQQLTYGLDYLIYQINPPGYKESEDPNEILAYIDAHESEIKKKDPGYYQAVCKYRDALSIILAEYKKSFNGRDARQSFKGEFFPNILTYDHLDKIRWKSVRGVV